MTGRDWVALVLASGLVAILLMVAWGVIFGGYKVTGEGAIGAIIGAIAVSIVRYLRNDR